MSDHDDATQDGWKLRTSVMLDVGPHARVASRDGARRVGAATHRGGADVRAVEMIQPALEGQLTVGGATGDGAEEPIEAGSAERPEDVG